MTTAIFSHIACLDHDPGQYHPECPARLSSILDALNVEKFKGLAWREAPMIDPAVIELAHPARFVDRVLGAIPPMGRAAFDADTVVSPGSREAALRAVGAVCAAVDAVAAGELTNAFCPVRPPGHHAEPERAMGFCLFNNVAIGAFHARKAHGYRRIAVVDFDVHHGNGTQAMFEHDADLFYASSHEYPLYPGTGSAEERGVGNIVNAPLPPGAGGREFRAAYERVVLPALDAFAPELLLISAGFDAHRADPLSTLELVEDDYAWITRELVGIARRRCADRVVSALEGGYDLEALANSAAAHVRELMAA
ncbi:MAG TPA: histone deacetylase family protein [Alphaproteobacteria bacterium]|nr:histone deacetylase family protein [Alphaproteobacteria bacterium]